MYEYSAKMIYVVDGDTVDLDVDLGLDIHHLLRVRLLGIDTPELHSSIPEEREKAKRARLFLREAMMMQPDMKSRDLVVKTEKDRTEKYGRYLATIFAVGDLISFNQKLLDAGLAVPYDGGPKMKRS